MSEDSGSEKSGRDASSTGSTSSDSSSVQSDSISTNSQLLPSSPSLNAKPQSSVTSLNAKTQSSTTTALQTTLTTTTKTKSSALIAGSSENGKEEEIYEGGDDEEGDDGPREPPRFNDVEKSLLSSGFKAFIKKKLPDVITIEDAITVFRGCQFVFCAEDFYKFNKELNAGKTTIDEDTFFRVISKIHCATEEEIQNCFDVVEVQQENKELVDVPKLRRLMMSDGERLNLPEWELFNLEIIPPPPPEDPKKKKMRRLMIKKKLKKGEVEKPPPPAKVPESYFRTIVPQLAVEVKLPEGLVLPGTKKKK